MVPTMDAPIELKAPKLNYLSGFGERLQKTLDALGVKAHGRLTLIKTWAGFSSAASVKRIFDEDRPPKREAFDLLVNELVNCARQARIAPSLTQEGISNYLLFGGRNPFEMSVPAGKPQGVDVLVEAKIIVRISDIAEQLGINIIRDIEERQRKQLISKVTDIVTTKKIELISDQMTEVIKSLINLAKARVLI